MSDMDEGQLRILEALTPKFRLDPVLDLSRVASACPFNFTGTDFYALCADVLLKATSRKAQETDCPSERVHLSHIPIYISLLPAIPTARSTTCGDESLRVPNRKLTGDHV
jgi:hypothetical protein